MSRTVTSPPETAKEKDLQEQDKREQHKDASSTRHSSNISNSSSSADEQNITLQEVEEDKESEGLKSEIEFILGEHERSSSVRLGDEMFVDDAEEEGSRGAFGWVRAFKNQNGDRIAVKRIRYKDSEFSEREEEADRDVAILNRLSKTGRKNAYYFVYQKERIIEIVTPWVDGHTLDDTLEGCESLEKYVRILFKTALALDSLQMNEIFHGDLKGDNIKVNSSENIFFIDFSFGRFKNEYARIFPDSSQHIAPECRASQAEASGEEALANASQGVFSLGETFISAIEDKKKSEQNILKKAFLEKLAKDLQDTVSVLPSGRPKMPDVIKILETAYNAVKTANASHTPYDSAEEKTSHTTESSVQPQNRELFSKLIGMQLSLVDIIFRQKKLVNLIGLFWYACLALKETHEQGMVTTNHADFKKIIVTLTASFDVQETFLSERRTIDDTADSKKTKEEDFLSFRKNLINIINDIKSRMKNNPTIDARLVNLSSTLSTTKSIDDMVEQLGQESEEAQKLNGPQYQILFTSATISKSTTESKKDDTIKGLNAGLFPAVNTPNLGDNKNKNSSLVAPAENTL